MKGRYFSNQNKFTCFKSNFCGNLLVWLSFLFNEVKIKESNSVDTEKFIQKLDIRTKIVKENYNKYFSSKFLQCCFKIHLPKQLIEVHVKTVFSPWRVSKSPKRQLLGLQRRVESDRKVLESRNEKENGANAQT